MVTPTNAQLGKLLASYFSTSKDTLAIHFRKHYSPILTPTPRKTQAKRPTPRLTNATFTYRWLATAPHRITTLYQYLLRAQWIATDTNPDDFFSLFAGKESNVRIKWTGSNLQLAYRFYGLSFYLRLFVEYGVGTKKRHSDSNSECLCSETQD